LALDVLPYSLLTKNCREPFDATQAFDLLKIGENVPPKYQAYAKMFLAQLADEVKAAEKKAKEA